MGKSGTSTSKAPEGMPHPSLLGPGASASNHNILDAISNRDSASLSPPRSRWLAWLLVPLLAAAAWGISTQFQKPSTPSVAPTPLATASHPPASPTAIAAVPIAAPSQATPTVAANGERKGADPFNALEATAATRVADALPGQPPAAIDMQATHNASSPPPRIAAASNSTDAPVKTATTKKPTPTKDTTQVAKTSAPSERKSPPKPLTEQRLAKKTAPTQTKTPPPGDPDVELLSAVMKHLGNQSRVSGAPELSSLTIAELVKSCKRKDSIEALLCQRRICEGSWGKAQACPKDLAPRPDLATDQTPG